MVLSYSKEKTEHCCEIYPWLTSAASLVIKSNLEVFKQY